MSWNSSLIDGPLTIYTFGEPDKDGVRPVNGTVLGYHLNVAPWLVTEEMSEFVQEPSTPAVTFAGGATGFLKFADEAEAQAVIPADYWTPDE